MTKLDNQKCTCRSPYDFSRVQEDRLDTSVNTVLQKFDSDHTIILLSGREETCRTETEQWLKDKGVNYNLLYMRAKGDRRKDTIAKEELFNTHIRDSYKVCFVIDDRKQVIRMWQGLGLKVLCCANNIDDDF